MGHPDQDCPFWLYHTIISERMGIDSLPSRPSQTESNTRPPDFYDPTKAPKRDEVLGSVPESTRQQWAQEQKEDGLEADVDLFLELNRKELGISKLGLKQARARILEEYRFLKEAEIVQDIEENDWKAFLAGEQFDTAETNRETQADVRNAEEVTRDTVETSRKDTETIRRDSGKETVDHNIDQEKSIDSYLGLSRQSERKG